MKKPGMAERQVRGVVSANGEITSGSGFQVFRKQEGHRSADRATATIATGRVESKGGTVDRPFSFIAIG